MHKSVIVSLSASVAFVSFLAIADDAARAPQPADTQQGQQSYLSAGCHHCHGQAAQGARGPAMASLKYPFEAFEIFVRQPAGGGMPPYSAAQLPDAELRAIYVYLAGLPGPAEELPALLR